MKFSIKSIKILLASIFISVIFCMPCFATGRLEESQIALTKPELNMFSQNNILFYNPAACKIRGGSGKLCGNTAEEKIWSILLRYFDAMHAAAAFGSIAHEGGFQPVKWEYGNVVSLSTCDFVSGMNWNDLYNGVYDGKYGVGSFGITSGLSTYLHHVNDTAPDLLEYFKDPSLTCLSTGDALAEKIGEGDYDRLIELEVTYFIEEWIGESRLNAFKQTTTLDDAAYYWAHNIEVCAACGYNKGDSQIYVRQASARGYYDQYKDFTCAASSSYTPKNASSNSTSDSSASGTNITWIGDSYSVGAQSIIQSKFSGISFGGSIDDANSTIQSCKFVGADTDCHANPTNPSALNVLDRVINANQLKSTLVMAVGTNGGWTTEHIDRFKTIMSSHPDTKVVFVNSRTPNNDYSASNELLKNLVNSSGNYYLADWASVYDAKYFVDSDIHPTVNGGYEKWVDVIANTISNMGDDCITAEGKYPQYYQGNYEKSDHENSSQNWTTISYNGGDVADSGCGPTSMAMLATVAAGQDIYPQDVIDITSPTGIYVYMLPGELDKKVGEKYGFEVIPDIAYSSKTDAYTKIKEYLTDGYMVHFSGEGCHDGFATPKADGSCTGGHYIGIFSISDNDKVWVANSAYMGNSEVDLQSVIDSIHNGYFTAIKGGGNRKTCGGYCKSENAISDDGLTYEQAKTFMMHYGANKGNSSSNVVGDHWNYCNGGGSNCATFSHFFIKKFTDLTYGHGDGNEVVDNLVRENSSLSVEREPRVWSVFSVEPNHTGIILGYHDGEWIVGHASCINQGIGEGDGTRDGGGSGFVVRNPNIEYALLESGNPKYAYLDVDLNAIQNYLETGE